MQPISFVLGRLLSCHPLTVAPRTWHASQMPSVALDKDTPKLPGFQTSTRAARHPGEVPLVTEIPLWMSIERLLISVTNKSLQNHHNQPRWISSSWADLWLKV